MLNKPPHDEYFPSKKDESTSEAFHHLGNETVKKHYSSPTLDPGDKGLFVRKVVIIMNKNI